MRGFDDMDESHFVIPNTIGVHAVAAKGMRAHSIDEVRQARKIARAEKLRFVPLGEGSNILPYARVDAFVCVIDLKGIRVIAETQRHISVAVGAGVNWHLFVQYSLKRGWFGLENLSLIPGSVGAAPVQNIGAYGVEVGAYIDRLTVLDEDGICSTLTQSDCQFAYRNSVFKQSDRRTILEVEFKLLKHPEVRWGYPDLRAELTSVGVLAPSPNQVAAAVMSVRRRKLPEPAIVPNVGSFFKNPLVSVATAAVLRARHPQFKQFSTVDTVGAACVKLSAAQLIDTAGWKDKPSATVACWSKQPLVLVNLGADRLEPIMSFAEDIQRDVLDKYGVQLEVEPSLLF